MKFLNPFLNQLADCPAEKPVLLTDRDSVPAGQLLCESQLLARNLKRSGVLKGDKVVLALPPGLDFLKIIYAAMILDLVVAIIDPEMGRDNYKAKLKQLDPKWAFVDYRLLLLQEHPVLRLIYFKLKKKGPYFPYSKKIKIIATGNWLPLFQKHTSLKELYAKNRNEFSGPEPSGESATGESNRDTVDVASSDFLITYTSGTTDMPKGVVHTYGSLERSISLISELVGDPGTQKLATHLPHFILLGITSGLPVHLWPSAMSPVKRLNYIERHKITMLFGPPCEYLELLQECKKQNRKLPRSLTHIMIGSAPVRASFLTKLIPYLPDETRITCLYGMTENLVVAAIDGRKKINYTCDGDVLGKPFKEIDIRFSADGEILIRSNQLFSRYFHCESRPDWHSTGDLGYFDGDQNLILMGRKKDMIIRRNMNIYPGLYEPTINKIPGIGEAVMVGVYNEALADEQVFLVVEKDEDITVSAIQKHLKTGKYSIDNEAQPDAVFFMDLPRKGRQRKVDKAAVVDAIKNRFGLVSPT